MVLLMIPARHYDLQLGWYGLRLRSVWIYPVETAPRFEISVFQVFLEVSC